MIAWSKLLRLVRFTETKLLFALALLVGLGTSVSAWAFIRLIETVEFWPSHPGESRFLGIAVGRLLIFLIPTIGGLLAGLALLWDPNAKGTGTADLMYALRRKDGKISPRYTVIKTIASIFTTCSGAAAGPEAPVVSIGAGIGSYLAGARKLSAEQVKNLAIAGAAAGFAAVFNAPIAGVLFAIEVLLREFASETFVMVILSTVTASISTHLLLGNREFVRVPPSFAFNHPVELVFYAALAILAAIVAKFFVQTYFAVDHAFADWKVPPYIKTMTGGAIIGLLALGVPDVMGNGHDVIPRVLDAEFVQPWTSNAMLILLLAKIVACAVTIGSGGSGGIFIPFLLMGAMVGGGVGRAVHFVFPAAAPAGAYMIVGMGAMFAGITFAPFTAIILMFELTGDYNLVLPLMFAVGVTTAFARTLDPESIDTRKLLKKGVRTHEIAELRALEKYHVEQVMTRRVITIPATMTLGAVSDFISHHSHTGYPVVEENGELVGLLTYAELKKTFGAGSKTDERTARDVMRRSAPTVDPHRSLTEAVRLMNVHDVDRIVVVDANKKIIGIVTKSNLIGIYKGLLHSSESD